MIRDKELTGALIASLISCYIRDNAAVDGISLHLQDICPLLYSTDDAVCSKVRCFTVFLSVFINECQCGEGFAELVVFHI